MRKILFVTLATIALPLYGGWVFNKSEVTVEVGRTDKSVWASDVHFGMGGFGPPEKLRSADRNIALVLSDGNGSLYIIGVSPGDTVIPKSTGGYYVKIHVVCGNELPVRAEQAVIAARAGEAVPLRAVSEIASSTTFQWYAGRTGDLSQPLATGGMQLTYTASTSPKQYVWVSATTPCSISTAEFEIDVPPARNRAVRH